jgi:hypothetical protein
MRLAIGGLRLALAASGSKSIYYSGSNYNLKQELPVASSKLPAA